jgi:hypothetical protein
MQGARRVIEAIMGDFRLLTKPAPSNCGVGKNPIYAWFPVVFTSFSDFLYFTHFYIFGLMGNVMHENPPASPPARAAPEGSGDTP